jgi:hypothetical protein
MTTKTITELYDEALKEINENNFWVTMGGKPTIIHTFSDVIGERVDVDGKKKLVTNELMNVQSVSDWKLTFSNKTILKEHTIYDRQGNAKVEVKEISLAEEWTKWKGRKTYLSYTFDPSWVQSDRPNSDVYNSWKGLTVKPIYHESQEDNINHYWNFVKEVLCGDNDEILTYIQNWCAHVFQKPSEKTEIALILRGNEGIGKNTFSGPLGAILGKHFGSYNNMDNILGRFNSHLIDKVLVLADEATWGGAKQQDGIFKDLITGKSRNIEYKGKDQITVDNYTNLIVNSNNAWCVAAGLTDRRLVFLNVSDKYIGNTVYWKKIYAFIRSTAFLESLLHFLKTRDISNFDPRERPQETITNGLDVQQSTISNSIQKFIIEFLSLNKLAEYEDGNKFAVQKKVGLHTIINRDLFDEYTDFCDKMKYKHREPESTFLLEVFGKKSSNSEGGYLPVHERPSTRKHIMGKKHTVTIVPSIAECRAYWETKFCRGVPQNWIEEPITYTDAERKTQTVFNNIVNLNQHSK